MAGPTGLLQTIGVSNGFYYTEANTAITEEHYGVVVVGDTALTVWTDEEGTDLLAKFGITGKTLTSDFPPLIIPGGLKSTNIRAETTNGGICLLRT